MTQGQPTYQQVGAELNIPWVFIGITHGMECGFNFKGHLHNGDPLTARTVQVPKARPATGNPPFTWSQSARDALIAKGYQQVTDWSVPHMLHHFERYNGMGYRRRGVPTPYLWSFPICSRKPSSSPTATRPGSRQQAMRRGTDAESRAGLKSKRFSHPNNGDHIMSKKARMYRYQRLSRHPE
ncbi:MAG: hypothetical protein IPL27_27850 [Lewinellaceae bacterium]|nr:hypothetical protein [Lewinellaceae bacterium]